MTAEEHAPPPPQPPPTGAGARRRDGDAIGGRLVDWLRASRHRTVLAGSAVAALLVGGGALWAWQTDAGAANVRYCWDAWDGEINERRQLQQVRATVPTGDSPEGSCVFRIDGREVTVTYAQPPADPKDRLDWFTDHVGSDTGPLPEELPGLVSGGRGLVVLPESCAVNGRASVVTIDAESELGHATSRTDVTGDLMIRAANQGMAATGCLPERQDWEYSSLRGSHTPQPSTGWEAENFCLAPGMHYDGSQEPYEIEDTEHHAWAYRDELQVCGVNNLEDISTPPDLLLMMIASPPLAGLFDDVVEADTTPPGAVGHGFVTGETALIRLTCDGDPLVLFRVGGAAQADDPLVPFVAVATERAGCTATGAADS